MTIKVTQRKPAAPTSAASTSPAAELPAVATTRSEQPTAGEIQVLSGRRVLCGRCRHDFNQSRDEGGPFDSPTGLTYRCGDCHAVYAVCRRCAWYMADGHTCHTCSPDDRLEGDAMLPKFIQQQQHLLVPDPASRSGHWLFPPTGNVVSMPPDWRPEGVSAVAPGTGADVPVKTEDERVGKRVEVLIGRYEGKRGQVSEVGAEGDAFGLRVILDEEGQEIPLDNFEQVRLLTPEEVAADEAALAEKKKAQTGS